MNTNVLLYETAYKILISMLPDGLDEAELQKYFVGDRRDPGSLKDVFVAFVGFAQNYQYMPNLIQFDKREVEIGSILRDYDYRYVSTLDPDELFDMFKERFSISSEKSWKLWCKAVVDSAGFVCSFEDISDFDQFVTKTQDIKSVPLKISQNIRGIGFTLACNTLKELGYLDYVKPDVHIKDICVELGISGDKQTDVFDAMLKIASDNGITPYKLDKVLWLVCSGNFYKDGIRVKGQKKELIDTMKESFVINGSVAKGEKRYTVSDSKVQADLEMVLIRKLEEKIHFSCLSNDKYFEFKNYPEYIIKPDIYSSDHHIIGEVYSHIGKVRSSQIDKIASDILKMIMF